MWAAEALSMLSPFLAPESASGTLSGTALEFFRGLDIFFLFGLGPSIPISTWLWPTADSEAGWRLFSIGPTGRSFFSKL